MQVSFIHIRTHLIYAHNKFGKYPVLLSNAATSAEVCRLVLQILWYMM